MISHRIYNEGGKVKVNVSIDLEFDAPEFDDSAKKEISRIVEEGLSEIKELQENIECALKYETGFLTLIGMGWRDARYDGYVLKHYDDVWVSVEFDVNSNTWEWDFYIEDPNEILFDIDYDGMPAGRDASLDGVLRDIEANLDSAHTRAQEILAQHTPCNIETG